jgi:hypothetical protein
MKAILSFEFFISEVSELIKSKLGTIVLLVKVSDLDIVANEDSKSADFFRLSIDLAVDGFPGVPENLEFRSSEREISEG